MENRFKVNEEEKNRILGLHLTESMDDRVTSKLNNTMERCENCDNKFQWKEVPSGWDEDYCESCNLETNHYECKNCREEVENPDTWCSRECYKEYNQ
jgi:predicted amidophosphoribosyltransferase